MINKEYKLSVLIPCYNDENSIKKVLNSLINQKYIPDQIIIADDCSSDKTVEIIKKFILANSDINLQLIQNKKNLGIFNNLKTNINKLENDIIFLGSANDIVYYDFFYDAVSAFNKNNNIKLFFGGFETKIGEKTIYTKLLKNFHRPFVIKSKNYLKYILLNNEIGVSFSPSTVYLKETLLKNYFIENLYSYHDTFTNNIIGLKYDTFYSPKIYSSWEYSPLSYSQKGTFKKILIYFRVIFLILFTKNIFLFKLQYIMMWIFIFPLKIIFNILFPFYKRLNF